MGASAPPLQLPEFRRRIADWFRSSADGVEVRHYVGEQPIYQAQESADQLFLLESGQVRLVATSRDRHSGTLALRLPGDLLGELSICGQRRRSEDAIALAPVTARIVRTLAFMAFVQREQLEAQLLEFLVWSLLEQRRALAMRLVDSSEQRLARALLEFSQRHDDPALPLTLSWQHLGDLIGTTPSRIGELLEDFRALGLIVGAKPNDLRVDPQGLEAYCR